MYQKYLTLILCIFGLRPEQRQCQLSSRYHFRQPLPIFTRNGGLLEPDNSYGGVILNNGEILGISCDNGDFIRHPNLRHQLSTSTIKCHGDDIFTNDELLNGPSQFSLFQCGRPPTYVSQKTNRTCYNNHVMYEVGYRIHSEFYPVYQTCFDELSLSPLYSIYEQKPYNAMFQQKVERPFFKGDDVYGEAPVERLFSPGQLTSAVAQHVGSRIHEYVNSRDYLSRGHLAAKTDFVFAFGERATFHYVNCAAQWYEFNSGNWNTLEVDLRNHIQAAGYNTIIYTGIYEVMHLKNDQERQVPIYMYSDRNNNPVIPVPLYYYKVVYVPETRLGIAFVGINNPHCNKSIDTNLFFCNDVCRSGFSWLSWEPDNNVKGYSFCCTVDDFRRTVPHLPHFEVRGLLT